MMPEVGLEDMPWTRFVPNALISIMTKVASGYYKVYDVVDGFTAITKRAIELINWNKAWKGYGYPMDFLVRLNAYGLKVSDVPQACDLSGGRAAVADKREEALCPPSGPYVGAWVLLAVVQQISDQGFPSPVLFFYLFGMLLLPLGVGFGVYLVYLQMTGVGVSGPEISCMRLDDYYGHPISVICHVVRHGREPVGCRRPMKVCMLTTGFPRFEGDLFGNFRNGARQGTEIQKRGG